MKNFVGEGDVLTVTAPAAVASGDFVQVNSYAYGFAMNSAANGAEVQIKTTGVFDAVKTAGAAWAVGDLLYWSGTAFTKTVGTNTLCAMAVAAAVSGATVGRVKLLDGRVVHG